MSVRRPLVLASGRPTELAATDQLPAGSIVGGLVLLGTYSVGETGLVTVGIAVRRYSVAIAGLLLTDRLVAVINGIPQNGSLQDVYPSAVGTASVGVLIPVLGVATTVTIPIVLYKVI